MREFLEKDIPGTNGLSSLSCASFVEDHSQDCMYVVCRKCPLAPEDHYYVADSSCTEVVGAIIDKIIERLHALWVFYISRDVVCHDMEDIVIMRRSRKRKKSRITILKETLRGDRV